MTFFAKTDGYNLVYAGTGISTNRVVFNLDTGLIVGQSGTSIVGSFIQPLKNGWFFCGVKTNYISNTTRTIGITLDTNLSSFQGDGVGGVLFWGLMFYANEQVQSLITTTTSQVTRPADQITVTVPMGATQCIYTINGIQEAVSVTEGETFLLPEGHITQLYMI